MSYKDPTAQNFERYLSLLFRTRPNLTYGFRYSPIYVSRFFQCVLEMCSKIKKHVKHVSEENVLRGRSRSSTRSVPPPFIYR